MLTTTVPWLISLRQIRWTMSSVFEGKNIVVGVCGGIAAYKTCELVRAFVKRGANVDVIMTEHATHFVTPLTLETLSNNPVSVDMFATHAHREVEHVSLAKKADLFVVCPATANIVGKYANGIADDMLSTTLMATTSQVVVCPAMNKNMYNSAAYKQNVQTLKQRGVQFVDSAVGFLACGDIGEGRLAPIDEIVTFCESALTKLALPKDLLGKRVLVTCGATYEKLDDARCITNFSSGRMGAAVVKAALGRGAEVTVVLARHEVPVDPRATVVNVATTQDMYDQVLARVADTDIFIFAGAPCDYRPEVVSDSKIKSDELTIKFVKNPDIAQAVGKVKGDKFVCVFSAETDHCEENARAKLTKKNADLCVLNDVKHNSVFGNDTNVVTLITKDSATPYPEMDKYDVANLILDRTVQ